VLSADETPQRYWQVGIEPLKDEKDRWEIDRLIKWFDSILATKKPSYHLSPCFPSMTDDLFGHVVFYKQTLMFSLSTFPIAQQA
jgi:hypothetical protein